ncbi:hypothetical protein HPB50_023640 [Hyalomma asiaticum]|uniref:Uncharacterized protein n=1 Tax=Hyalomma asiaticum TaxID=266040 RepID=A0ACB7T6Q7_HYAAI|nr:hypothetical protein HPB50_023640 [Hyalomma asiaticum]
MEAEHTAGGRGSGPRALAPHGGTHVNEEARGSWERIRASHFDRRESRQPPPTVNASLAGETISPHLGKREELAPALV